MISFDDDYILDELCEWCELCEWGKLYTLCALYEISGVEYMIIFSTWWYLCNWLIMINEG